MNQTDVKSLLEKYRIGIANEQERQLLENWYAQESVNQMKQPELEDYVRIKDEMWAKLAEDVQAGDDQMQHTGRFSVHASGIRLRRFAAVLAAAVTALTLGVWLYYTPHGPAGHSGARTVKRNDIAPGRNTAVLTLANGEIIQLSDAKNGVVIDNSGLKYNDQTEIGSSLYHSGPMVKKQWLTASTPRGGTYQVVLPDGSKVWLNAASSLKFPSSFSGDKQRRVQLEGEAYFEISKNKAQKFVVESSGQVVEVLGTHFNINSYADERSVKTTLLEGSVMVNGHADTVVLRPDQQALLISGRRMIVRDIDAHEAVDWKDGLFIFNKEPLENIMRKISRWYDAEVIFENEQLKKKLFGGTVSRLGTVSEVLEILELTELAHFKIEGRRIMVTK